MHEGKLVLPVPGSFEVVLFMECGDVTPLLFLSFMECGDVTPLWFLSFMECGDVTPLWFLSFMECGDVTPLWFLCLAWQRAQKKNSKKQEKHRNQSGVTSPHSIKNATPKPGSKGRAGNDFMQTDQLRRCLESPEQVRKLLVDWRLSDFERGKSNLVELANILGLDALSELCHPLGRLLPRCPDPDMALNNLDRYFASAGTAAMPTLMEGRARTLETMLQLFSTSQFFSDLLILNPDYLEMMRIPLRSSPSRTEMLDQLRSEVESAYEDSNVLRAFRRFRQKQILRIGTNDIIRDRPLEEITRDISRVADTALEIALETAIKNISRRFGDPFTNDGDPARCVILGFGKLGGKELNYSSDIDLMFIYDYEGQTRGNRVTAIGNDDYFARVCSEVVRLLSAHTDRGQAYRVDLRLRPEGQRGSR